MSGSDYVGHEGIRVCVCVCVCVCVGGGGGGIMLAHDCYSPSPSPIHLMSNMNVSHANILSMDVIIHVCVCGGYMCMSVYVGVTCEYFPLTCVCLGVHAWGVLCYFAL